jgi:Niemann-Pick C1 protein
LFAYFSYDEEAIRQLTSEDILEAVNVIKESPHFGHAFDYSSLLGGIQRDAETGKILSAKSAFHIWVTRVDANAILSDTSSTGLELDLADATNLLWEEKLIRTLLNSNSSNFEVLVNVARSFNDISSSAIFFDGVKMVSGYLLMFMYTVFMLGRVNRVEHRTYLTAAGIFAVAMGLVQSIGISSMLNLPYSPMHAILPFLCLGIGIDDMFVIVQCWNNLSNAQEDKTLHEKVGLVMRHAGVAITVTSLTDVFAFGVGAVTVSHLMMRKNTVEKYQH